MKKQKSLQTIDDILLNDLSGYVDYAAILKVIYCYYLNDTEREIYNAALLYFSGKTQKDIGIILNIDQSYFNVSFYKLIRKMKSLSKVLYADRDILIEYLFKLRNFISKEQYACVSLLLGGNNHSDVADLLGYSICNIYKIKNSIFKRLSKEDAHTLNTYLDVFKKTIFYKK